MKLEMSLPAKPGMLHALPLLDILALVMLFVMVLDNSSRASQAGVQIELPETNFRLQRVAKPVLLTITGGEEPRYWVGRQRVERSNLLAAIDEAAGKSEEVGRRPAVLMQVDKSADSTAMEISYELLSAGYDCLRAAKRKQK